MIHGLSIRTARNKGGKRNSLTIVIGRETPAGSSPQPPSCQIGEDERNLVGRNTYKGKSSAMTRFC